MQPPKLGSPVVPIIVHGSQGAAHPLVYKPAATHDHLLLVMSPDCPYCEKNWPMWDTLTKRLPHGMDVTYYDVTGKFDKRLAEAHHIKQDQMVTAPIDSTMRAHFVGTPTTILVGDSGKVKGVWQGVLNKEDVGKILAMSDADSAR